MVDTWGTDKIVVSSWILYVFWKIMIKNRLEFTNKALFVVFFAFS